MKIGEYNWVSWWGGKIMKEIKNKKEIKEEKEVIVLVVDDN